MLTLAARAGAAVGDLDLGFASSGVKPFGFAAEAIRERPDEKLVVVGWKLAASLNSGVIVQLLPDGTADSGFGSAGSSVTSVGSGSRFYDVLPQADGGALAVGWAYVGSGTQWLLQRFDAAGTLDPTFGTGGTVTLSIQGVDRAWRVAEDGGKFLVIGSVCALPSDALCHVALARFEPTGALDATFGTGGISITDLFAVRNDAGRTVAASRQSDGTLLIGTGTKLARLLPGGALDPSFGVGGQVDARPDPYFYMIRDLTVQPDGKILVAVEDVGIVRFGSNGAIDAAFGDEGYARRGGQSVGVEADGSIVVTSASAPCLQLPEQPTTCGTPVFRLRADGALDTTFGPGGAGLGALGADRVIGRAVLVRATGEVVVVGGLNSSGGASQWLTGGCPQAIKPKLKISGIGTSKRKFQVSGTLQVPSSQAFDPSVDGLRLRITGRYGAVPIATIFLPGGPPWRRNGKGTAWIYKNPAGGPGGVAALRMGMKAGNPAPMKFKLVIKGHSYYSSDYDLPIAFQVELDVAAPVSAQCSAGSFHRGFCEEVFAAFDDLTGVRCRHWAPPSD